MISLGEILIAGVWGAAAVQVFAYTWEAYTGTQIPFPGIGGGVDNSTPGPGQPIPKHGASVGPGGIKPSTGGTPLEPPGMPSGRGVNAPPLVVITPILTAMNAGDKRRTLIEIQRLVDWGNQKGPSRHGWGGNTLNGNVLIGPIGTWVFGQPWFKRANQLVGLQVVQTQ